MNANQQGTCVRRAIVVSLFLAVLGVATVSRAEDNTSVIISGTTSNHGGADFFVGFTGTNNTLLINNGGVLDNVANAGISVSNTAIGNWATVTGNGSVWNNSGTLTVGGGSYSNILTISNGGQVSNATGYVGREVWSVLNTVLVIGTNSVWNNSGYLYLGDNGGMNSLIISNGGTVRNTMAIVGSQSNSRNNQIVVDGAGSRWLGDDMNFGNLGSGNMLTIRNGGSVSNQDVYVANSGGFNNQIDVGGTNSEWRTRDIYFEHGAGNALTIHNSGRVYSANAVVGDYASGSNNTIIVSGAGSRWDLTGSMQLGPQSFGNTLLVTGQGRVQVAGNATIGGGTGSDKNVALVEGSGSRWDIGGLLTVGAQGNSQALIVTNGGRVQAGSIVLGSTNLTAAWQGSGVIVTNTSYGSAACSATLSSGAWVVSDMTTYWGSTGINWPNITWLRVGGSYLLLSWWTNSGSALIVPISPVVITNAGFGWNVTNAWNDLGSLNLTNLIAGGGVLTGGSTLRNNITGQSLYFPPLSSFPSLSSALMGSMTGATVKVSQGTLETGGMTVRNGTLQIDPLSTVHVTGNYTQTMAGVLALGIGGTAPGSYGQLTVDGVANLDGLLRITAFNSYRPVIGHTQTVVQAGSVTGQFYALENAVWLLLRPVLVYDNPQTVDLVWTPISLMPFTQTPNQQSLAANLDGAVADPRLHALQSFLYFLPINMVPLALDVIAPEELTALFATRFAGMEGRAGGFLGRIQELRSGSRGFSANRLSLYEQDGGALELVSTRGLPASPICYDICDPTPANPWGVYVEGSGEFIHIGSDANAAGYHLRGGGLTVGLDRRLNEQLVLGVSLGYEHVAGDLTDNGDVDLDNGHLTGYALWYGANWYAAGMVGGGHNAYDSRRATFDGFARGETTGTEFTGLLTAGYDWQRGAWMFGPQATLQYKWVNIGGFVEGGSLAAMNVPEQVEDAFHTQLGGHLTRRWQVGRVTLQPNVSVAWRHEFLDSSNALASQFANGAGTVYTVTGPEVARDSLALGVGLTVQWTPTVGTYLNYSTELGRDGYQPHTINGGVSIRF